MCCYILLPYYLYCIESCIFRGNVLLIIHILARLFENLRLYLKYITIFCQTTISIKRKQNIWKSTSAENNYVYCCQVSFGSAQHMLLTYIAGQIIGVTIINKSIDNNNLRKSRQEPYGITRWSPHNNPTFLLLECVAMEML